MTLPSGNILIVGGSLVASGSGGNYYSQNPSYQVLNPATLALSYKKPLPSSIILDAVPFALYPLMWQLPHTPSILARSLPCDAPPPVCAQPLTCRLPYAATILSRGLQREASPVHKHYLRSVLHMALCSAALHPMKAVACRQEHLGQALAFRAPRRPLRSAHLHHRAPCCAGWPFLTIQVLCCCGQVIDGVFTRVIQMSGDAMVDLDRNYGLPPNFQYPPTFYTMAASVLLPLKYPLYTPEVRIACLTDPPRLVTGSPTAAHAGCPPTRMHGGTGALGNPVRHHQALQSPFASGLVYNYMFEMPETMCRVSKRASCSRQGGRASHRRHDRRCWESAAGCKHSLCQCSGACMRSHTNPSGYEQRLRNQALPDAEEGTPRPKCMNPTTDADPDRARQTSNPTAAAANPRVRARAQVLLMGGADGNGHGLSYSQRLTSVGAGLQASLVQEDMQGVPRIEGTAVLLPDGTVFLCSGASNGKSSLKP